MMDINTSTLRELIVEHLSESEFATICFDLNETYPELKFDFDKDIPGHLNFSSKVMETIKYMRRRTALEKLVAQIHKAWPDIDLTPVGYKPIPPSNPIIPTVVIHNERENMEETWITLRRLLRNPNYYAPDNIRHQLIPDLGYNPAALAGPEAGIDSLINRFVDQVRADGKLTRLVAEMKTRIPNIETLLGVQAQPPSTPSHNPNPSVEQSAGNNPQPTNPGKPAIEYVDFDIRVSDKTERGYPVEASYSLNGRAGTPSIYQVFNLDDPDFKNWLSFLEGLVAEEIDTKLFGKHLGQWLFPYQIRALYSTLQGTLGNSKGIRLRLEIDPAELSSLPWEYCYDDLRQNFIARNPFTPIVRYIDQPYTPNSLEAPRPLKILMVLANPQNLPALDAQKELTLLQNALKPLGNQVQIEVLQDLEANARKIQGKILDFQPHVLHFVGHGQFKEDKGSIFLVNSQGQAVAWGDEQFADTVRNSSVKLVILNACETAKRSDQHALVGVAPRLILAGIPAVIAMQFAVPDKVALVVTETLYENLVRGQALDEAITQMRIAVNNMAEDELRWLWAVPVLFMRSPDGRLWGTKSATSNPAGEKPAASQPVATNPTPSQPTTQTNQSNRGNSGGFNFNIGGNATFHGDQIMGDKHVTINNNPAGTESTPKELTLAERIQKISQDLAKQSGKISAERLAEAQGYLKDAEEKAQTPAPSGALIKYRLEKTLEIVLVDLAGDPQLVGQLDQVITLSKKI